MSEESKNNTEYKRREFQKGLAKVPVFGYILVKLCMSNINI